MPRLPLAAATCLALAFGGAFAAGCGSDDKKDSGDAAPSPPAAEPRTTGGTSASASATVDMKNSKFVPDKISVTVGTQITWTNKDGYAHNVTSTAGEEINSGNVDGGKTFEFAPKKAGTIAYTCTLHPNQNGAITVTK